MLLIELSSVEYQQALAIQNSLVQQKISAGGPDVVLVLEHPPTVTLGIRGKGSDLLVSEECLKISGIEVHNVDRGGEATFHGPGQIVCYPILDLRSLRISVREYVRKLEEVIIVALNTFGISGYRQDNKIGVWTGSNDKIASIGIRINRRITYHGFSLNVDLRTNPSEFMISCGMPEARLISVNELVSEQVSMDSARKAIERSFAAEFETSLEPCSLNQVFP